MFKKEIANIVFYTVPNGTGLSKQATIFLNDGTIRNVSFEEGIDACEEIVKAKNIQTKDAFKEMINHNIVHVTTAEDFRNRFEEFIPEIQPIEETEIAEENDRLNAAIVNPSFENNDPSEDETRDIYSNSDNKPRNTFEDVYSYSSPKERDFLSDDFKEDEEDNYDEEEEAEEENVDDYYDDAEEDEYDEIIDEEEEKEGFFKRAWRKIKNSTGVKVVVACVTALAIGLGLASCAKRHTKEGVMANSNISSVSTTSNSNSDDDSIVVLKDGAYTQDRFSDNTEIKSLLDKTSNQTQKTAMINTGNAMDGFNNVFAYLSKEKGKDIRPSLKFEEVMALQVAYNDYSREELVSIFNGADIKSGDFSRAYKDANLQLMAAYAMESPKHPVDMSMLIESQEGKDFYQKYHKAFLAIKKAKDEDKAAYASKFYKMVRKDFPVTQKVRTEGISHAENYESITSYKLAVTPMIAAAEMMWQNLKTDVTLKDMEVDFINDLGLCNYADKAFSRAELLSLSNPVDTTNPTYEEYKEAFIKFYKDHDIYYVDDEHRELTKLKAFQNAVNWHFKKDLGTSTTKTTTGGTKTSTRTTTKTYTKTNTTTHTETTRRNVPVTPEARRQVDDELDKENEQARTAAEQEAERNRQRMQEEEDRHAEEVESEVQRDAEDLQNNINNANEQINRNNADDDRSNDVPVNENDLGHGVKFDDEHSDGNGNLNSSVSNITTDSTGDKTNDPLPDPNETGKEFDARANSSSKSSSNSTTKTNTSSNTSTSTNTNTSTNTSTQNNNQNQWVESVQVADDYYYENAWVEYEDDYSSAVDSYVESMANSSSEDSAGYSYHK